MGEDARIDALQLELTLPGGQSVTNIRTTSSL
jgi:hypothetical protein